MMDKQYLLICFVYLFSIHISLSSTTTESSTVTSEKSTTTDAFTTTEKETTISPTSRPKSTTSQTASTTSLPKSTTSLPKSTTSQPKSTTSQSTSPTPTTSSSTTSTTTKSSSTTSTTTTTTTTAQPQVSTEWQDIEEEESVKLVNFVVSEIQKLKVEHKELDECQELDLSSVLSGKKLNGKPIKYSITLKVQPQVKNIEECLQQNSTMTNMHPEICEADVTEGDRGGTGTDGKTLLRSTCLQVEELQD